MLTQEINLKIHEEADLYSPYDPSGVHLSEDVIAYFSRCYLETHEKDKEKVLLRIESDTPVARKTVEERIRAHFGRELKIARRSLKILMMKEICIGFLGLMVLSLWLMLSAKSGGLHVEVLSMIAGVSIWEATNLAIIQHPALYKVKKEFEYLQNAEIHISDPVSGGGPSE